MSHEHLLIIRFSALGDVAMTVPVVWALARQYPQLRITVLSRPFARPFFETLAPNVNFMAADLKGEYHGMKGLNALYRRLTAKQFTHIADLHSVLRSNYLRLRFNLGRCHVEHIDKHRTERRHLVARGKKKVLAPLPTPFDNYADVFRRLGFPISNEMLCFQSIFDRPESTNHTTTLDKSEGANHTTPPAPPSNPQNAPLPFIPERSAGEPWIGLAPFAAHPGKTYPPQLTTRLVELLTECYPQARIYLFGRGEQEEQFFGQCCSRWPQCCNVAHHTEGIRQELVLMSRLDVMVSMDSSNMHLASLVGLPVVSIWGATHPYAGFMGWHQSTANAVQRDDLDCRPCSIYGNKPCHRGDYACLYGITPETILERINTILTTAP